MTRACFVFLLCLVCRIQTDVHFDKSRSMQGTGMMGHFSLVLHLKQSFRISLSLRLRGNGVCDQETSSCLVKEAEQVESDAWDGRVHKQDLEELVDKAANWMYEDQISANAKDELFQHLFNVLIALAHMGKVTFSETVSLAESMNDLRRLHTDNSKNAQLSYCALLSSIANMARTTNSTGSNVDFMQDALRLVSDIRAKGMSPEFQVYAILESLVVIICTKQGLNVRSRALDCLEEARSNQVLDPVISDVLLWVLQGTSPDEKWQNMSTLSQNECAHHYVMKCVLHAILGGRHCSMPHVIAAWQVINHWGFADSKPILETMLMAALKLEQIGEALPIDIKMVIDLMKKSSFTDPEISKVRMDSLSLMIGADVSNDRNAEEEEIWFPQVTEETQPGPASANNTETQWILEMEKKALAERLAIMSEEEIEGPEPPENLEALEAAKKEQMDASLESDAGNQTKESELNITWEEWERIAENCSITVSEAISCGRMVSKHVQKMEKDAERMGDQTQPSE